MSAYLEVVKEVYAEAAQSPDVGMCCTAAPPWTLPGLVIPQRMLEMNYGCGSTVDPRELRADDTVLYVGVGGGLEALQFAYCLRTPGGVVAVDPVAEMREQAQANFQEAARLNPWFRPEFVRLLDGNALDLPLERGSVSVVAQNCLFNVFRERELKRALGETVRVLKRGGRFYTSDPITPEPLPQELLDDDRMRARCLSGCQTFERYTALMAEAGFGRIEVRARVPYRVLTPAEYPVLSRPILLESIEAVGHKTPPGDDGPAVFTGRTATYVGGSERLVLDNGQVFQRGMPEPISDAAAARLRGLTELLLSEPTFHARGGGCC